MESKDAYLMMLQVFRNVLIIASFEGELWKKTIVHKRSFINFIKTRQF